MATKKSFDCIAMKREGAIEVRKRLAGMSREEELRYWQQETDRLLDFQRDILQKRKAS